jgi:hypothetical protein
MENEDFYIENGYYVFTEKYHLKRGYCCKSSCRHCPWNYSKSPSKNSETTKKPLKNNDQNDN